MTMSNRVWCAPFNPGPVQRATQTVDDFKKHNTYSACVPSLVI